MGTRRLRVLISAFACEPEEGSEPEVGWRWATLMARDNDVVVLTQEKNRKHIEPFLKRNPEAGANITFVYHEYLPCFRRLKRRFSFLMLPYYALWQWSIRAVVDELVDEYDIDLIHHATFASFRMPVFLRGRPIVWGPVGGADTAPRHLLGFHGPWKSVLREKLRNWSTTLAVKLLPWIDPSVRTRGYAFASTSETGSAFAEGAIPVTVLPTVGMIPNESRRKTFTREGSPLRLLFVGRLHHLKGLQFLFEAFREIPKEIAKLSVVGTGPQEDHLKNLVKKMGLEDRVNFLGFKPRPELSEVYLSHDLLIAPSLYESGGLSILEAFSFGLPAVALGTGGPALMVGPECGTLIDVELPVNELCDGIGNAILGYEQERSLLAQQGAKARERLDRLYSWDGKRESMQAAYDQVMKRKIDHE